MCGDDKFEYDAVWQRDQDKARLARSQGPERLILHPELITLLRRVVYNAYVDSVVPSHSLKVRHTNDKLKMILDCIDDQFPNAREYRCG